MLQGRCRPMLISIVTPLLVKCRKSRLLEFSQLMLNDIGQVNLERRMIADPAAK